MARFRNSARLGIEHLEDRRVLSSFAIGLDLPRPLLELSFASVRASFDVPTSTAVETISFRMRGHGEPKHDNPKHDEPANITVDPVRVSIALAPGASIANGVATSALARSPVSGPKPVLSTVQVALMNQTDAAVAPAEAAPVADRSISLPIFSSGPPTAAPVGVPSGPAATLSDDPRVLSQAPSARDLGARWFGDKVSADGQETRSVRPAETPSVTGVLPTPRPTRDASLADELTLLQTPPDVLAPADHDANLGLAIQQFLQQLDDVGREVARALSGSGWWTWVAAGPLGAAGLEMMRRRLRRQALAAAIGGDEDLSLTSVPGLPGPFSSEQS